MRLITQFWVPGKPATAGSKTAYRTPKGRMIVAPASKFTKPWMAQVRNVASSHYGGDLTLLPVELCVEFHLARPKGHYKSDGSALSAKGQRNQYPAVKPDTTKLLRAIEDALTGIIWKDDSQIISQMTRKCYVHQWGQPGALVAIYAIGAEDSERLRPSDLSVVKGNVCYGPPCDSRCREEVGGTEGEGIPTLF